MMRRLLVTATLTAAALGLTTLAPATAQAGFDCGGFAYATPFKPGKVSEGSCGYLGSPGARVHYSWYVPAPSSGRACVEGLGWVEPQGPTADGKPLPAVEKWFSLGCGTRGAAPVPWGNIAAVPKVRAESLMVPLGTPVQWRY